MGPQEGVGVAADDPVFPGPGHGREGLAVQGRGVGEGQVRVLRLRGPGQGVEGLGHVEAGGPRLRLEGQGLAALHEAADKDEVHRLVVPGVRRHVPQQGRGAQGRLPLPGQGDLQARGVGGVVPRHQVEGLGERLVPAQIRREGVGRPGLLPGEGLLGHHRPRPVPEGGVGQIPAVGDGDGHGPGGLIPHRLRRGGGAVDGQGEGKLQIFLILGLQEEGIALGAGRVRGPLVAGGGHGRVALQPGVDPHLRLRPVGEGPALSVHPVPPEADGPLGRAGSQVHVGPGQPLQVVHAVDLLRLPVIDNGDEPPGVPQGVEVQGEEGAGGVEGVAVLAGDGAVLVAVEGHVPGVLAQEGRFVGLEAVPRQIGQLRPQVHRQHVQIGVPALQQALPGVPVLRGRQGGGDLQHVPVVRGLQDGGRRPVPAAAQEGAVEGGPVLRRQSDVALHIEPVGERLLQPLPGLPAQEEGQAEGGLLPGGDGEGPAPGDRHLLRDVQGGEKGVIGLPGDAVVIGEDRHRGGEGQVCLREVFHLQGQGEPPELIVPHLQQRLQDHGGAGQGCPGVDEPRPLAAGGEGRAALIGDAPGGGFQQGLRQVSDLPPVLDPPLAEGLDHEGEDPGGIAGGHGGAIQLLVGAVPGGGGGEDPAPGGGEGGDQPQVRGGTPGGGGQQGGVLRGRGQIGPAADGEGAIALVIHQGQEVGPVLRRHGGAGDGRVLHRGGDGPLLIVVNEAGRRPGGRRVLDLLREGELPPGHQGDPPRQVQPGVVRRRPHPADGDKVQGLPRQGQELGRLRPSRVRPLGEGDLPVPGGQVPGGVVHRGPGGGDGDGPTVGGRGGQGAVVGVGGGGQGGALELAVGGVAGVAGGAAEDHPRLPEGLEGGGVGPAQGTVGGEAAVAAQGQVDHVRPQGPGVLHGPEDVAVVGPGPAVVGEDLHGQDLGRRGGAPEPDRPVLVPGVPRRQGGDVGAVAVLGPHVVVPAVVVVGEGDAG